MLSAISRDGAAAHFTTFLATEKRPIALQTESRNDDGLQDVDDLALETIFDEIFCEKPQSYPSTSEEMLVFEKNTMLAPHGHASVSVIGSDIDLSGKHISSGNGAFSSVPILSPQIVESPKEDREHTQQVTNCASLATFPTQSHQMLTHRGVLGEVQKPNQQEMQGSWEQTNGIFSQKQPVPTWSIMKNEDLATAQNKESPVVMTAYWDGTEEQPDRHSLHDDDAAAERITATESQQEENHHAVRSQELRDHDMIATTTATGQSGSDKPGGFAPPRRMEQSCYSDPSFVHTGKNDTKGIQRHKRPLANENVKNKGGRPRKNIPLAEKRKRNRDHAKKSRLRKKLYTNVLQESAENLKAENRLLRQKLRHALGRAKVEQLVAAVVKSQVRNDQETQEQGRDDVLTVLLNRPSSQRVVDDAETLKFLQSLGKKEEEE